MRINPLVSWSACVFLVGLLAGVSLLSLVPAPIVDERIVAAALAEVTRVRALWADIDATARSNAATVRLNHVTIADAKKDIRTLQASVDATLDRAEAAKREAEAFYRRSLAACGPTQLAESPDNVTSVLKAPPATRWLRSVNGDLIGHIDPYGRLTYIDSRGVPLTDLPIVDAAGNPVPAAGTYRTTEVP